MINSSVFDYSHLTLLVERKLQTDLSSLDVIIIPIIIYFSLILVKPYAAFCPVYLVQWG